MRDYWQFFIEPLLQAMRARTVLYFGDRNDALIGLLTAYVASADGLLHIVDGVETEANAESEQAQVTHHASFTDFAIAARADVVLLQSDPNWYTTRARLSAVSKAAAQAGRTPAPILIADVAWPYARRDCYRDLRAIPGAYVLPNEVAGLRPDAASPGAGGLHGDRRHALTEGVFQNGVLTAIEDFLLEHPGAWRFQSCDAFGGLGVLWPVDGAEGGLTLVEALAANGPQRGLLDALSAERLRLQLALEDEKLELSDMAARAAASAQRAEGAEEREKALKAEWDADRKRVREQKDALAQRARKIEILRETLRQYDLEMHAQREAAARGEAAAAALSEANGELAAARGQLEAAREQTMAAQAEIITLKASAANNAQRLASLATQLEEARASAVEASVDAVAPAELAASQAATAAAQREVARVSAELGEARLANEKAHSQLEKERERSRSLSVALAQHEKDLAQSSRSLAKALAKCAAYERSKIWRLFAPYRALRNKLKGGGESVASEFIAAPTVSAPVVKAAPPSKPEPYGAPVVETKAPTPTVALAPVRVLGHAEPAANGAALNGYAELLEKSHAFDADFYRRQVNGSAVFDGGEAEHYLSEGASAGLDPGPFFSTSFYVARYPLVAAAGVNPLVDYLLVGAALGRNPNPDFDTDQYRRANPELSDENPLEHFIKTQGQARH